MKNKKAPFCLDGERTLFVDVDETLALTKFPNKLIPRARVIRPFGYPIRVVLHQHHADVIKQFKGRGHSVVVWSAGGWKWAKAIVEEMGLSDYVDVISGKPDWIVDDKPAHIWMGERFFLDPETGETVVDTRDGGEE